MRRFRIATQLIKKNLKTLIIFEAIYKIITLAIITPLLVEMINLSLELAGINYLTNKRILEFLVKPTTVAILILTFIVFAVFIMVEFAAIIYLYDTSYHDKSISVFMMFKAGFKSSLRVIAKHNGFLLLFVIIMIPVTHFTMLSSYISYMEIPDFIITTIQSRISLKIVFMVLYLVVCIFAIRLITSMHYFVNEKFNFADARKASINLNKHAYLGLVTSLILWQIATLLVFFVSYVGLAFVITNVIKMFVSKKAAYSSTLYILTKIYDIWMAIYSAVSVSATLAFISGYYYSRKIKIGETISVPVLSEHKIKDKTKFQKRLSIVLFVCALLNIVYINNDFGLYGGNSKVQFFSRTQIAAHRGDSVDAPENTLSAINSAIDKHADFAEIDVQQTKDGEIVVLHDSSLKRTTGINEKVWNLTYEEVQELDAGSWFSDQYIGEPIPKLSEVLELAKGNIKLNIEIKRTGHEKDIEKKVVDLIEEYEFVDDCIVTSFQPSALKKVKECNPDVKTGYILSVAFGDFSKEDYADALSVNYSFATSILINRAHDAKKQVYVWTVNDSENVSEMIKRGADMIITDNPVMARETLTSYYKNPWLVKLIKYLSE